MQKTLPLYLGPSVIGSAVLTAENGTLSAVAKTYASVSGICRAYIKGVGGTLLVGVLSPDGPAFCAKQTFSKSLLASRNINPDEITYAFVLEKSSAETAIEWLSAKDAGEASENKLLSSLLRASGALVDNIAFPRRIALPLSAERPFPRPDILCIVTPVRIGGDLFGAIAVDENGEVGKLKD